MRGEYSSTRDMEVRLLQLEEDLSDLRELLDDAVDELEEAKKQSKTKAKAKTTTQRELDGLISVLEVLLAHRSLSPGSERDADSTARSPMSGNSDESYLAWILGKTDRLSSIVAEGIREMDHDAEMSDHDGDEDEEEDEEEESTDEENSVPPPPNQVPSSGLMKQSPPPFIQTSR